MRLANPKMKYVLFPIILSIVCVGWTDNKITRRYGGSETVNLETGHRLLNATWKGDSLWYITEKMPEGYVPSTKYFREKSSYGIFQGQVAFVERR